MFVTITAESWQDTKDLAQALSGFVYRGHADASWALNTTLQRAVKQFFRDELSTTVEFGEFVRNREIWTLRQFQRRAHHYIDDLPSRDRTLEWLALIQHYGGPTRLLDFTHSFYVAAFFALENALTDACVWAISTRPIEEFVKTETCTKADNERIDETNERHIQLVEKFILTNERKKMVVYVEPERMNERLSIQQGVFLFPCDIACSFKDNLAATLPESDAADSSFPFFDIKNLKDFTNAKVIKIVIPRKSHTFALNDLRKMNISSATLFPGLDGFARSLYLHLRALDLDVSEYQKATHSTYDLRSKP